MSGASRKPPGTRRSIPGPRSGRAAGPGCSGGDVPGFAPGSPPPCAAVTALSPQLRRRPRPCCGTEGATPPRPHPRTDCTAPPSPPAGGSPRHRPPGPRQGHHRHRRPCGTGTGTPSPPSEHSWVSGTPARSPRGAELCAFGQAAPEPPSLTCPFSPFLHR